MCFHDDDILHPNYIEIALKYFATIPDLNILSTVCHTPEKMSNSNWEKVSSDAIYCKDYFEFSSYLYYESEFAYPSVIYRTKKFKNTVFNKKPYGKIDDKIRCIEICKGGSAVILRDKHFLRYRIHDGQDSATSKNGPFCSEIIEFNKYFKNILCAKKISRDRFLFYLRNFDWIYFLYYWGNNTSITFKHFIIKCKNEGAASIITVLFLNKSINRIRKLLKKRIHIKRKIIKLDNS